jgi:DNA polymerase IV (DinB-like DNA polymerase)
MDAFFAACEEKYEPQLKKKPLIIGALPSSKRGIVSTANYGARKFGIGSAMPISEAYRRCPQGEYRKPRFSLYKKESKQVMQILSMFCTRMEQVSIDEAYLDITDFVEEAGLRKAAVAIRKAVLDETGLSCSLGISESRYVSKIASDFRKPGGIVVVKDPKRFLAPLPLGRIPGIGKKSLPVLNRYGLETIGDLADLEQFTALKVLGKWGIKLLRIARGEDRTGIKEHDLRKSQGVERTFQEDKPKDECRCVIESLCKELQRRMGHYSYKTVSIKVRFSDFSTITRDRSLSVSAYGSDMMQEAALSLFSLVECKQDIRLLGVRVGNLCHEPVKQMKLSEF